VTAPLLLVYSQADPTVPVENAAIIAREAGSQIVERHTLRESGHILTQHVERETVFTLVADFIARRKKGNK
jgi:esterase/lipase